MTTVADELIAIDDLLDCAARTEGKYRGRLESEAKNRLKRLRLTLEAGQRPTQEIQEDAPDHELLDTMQARRREHS